MLSSRRLVAAAFLVVVPLADAPWTARSGPSPATPPRVVLTRDTVRAAVVARAHDSADAFSGLEFAEALEIDPRGWVYVLDGGAYRLTAFDTTGHHRWSVGRKGHGPGEFESPVGMTWAPDGSLWVIDTDTQRATIISAAGRVLRTRPLISSFSLAPWPGRFDDQGRLLHYASSDSPGFDFAMGVFDGTLTQVATRRPPAPPRPLEYFEGREERGSPMRSLVPFTPRLVWRLDRRGRFVSAWTAELSFSRDGSTLGAPQSGAERGPPVTPAERRDAVTGLASFTRRGGRVDPSRIPYRKPPLATFVLDDADRIWAMRSQVAGVAETRFEVFSAEGRHERTVIVPVRLLEYPVPVVRGAWIAGVERDAEGEETVVLARVP